MSKVGTRCSSSRKYRMRYCPTCDVFSLYNYPHDCTTTELPVAMKVKKLKGQKKGRG